MKRILVGVDGSDESKAAIRFAVAMAPALRASVKLVNVVVEGLGPHSSLDHLPEALRTAGALLLSSAKENPIGVAVPDSDVLTGHPGEEIARAAGDDDVALVILGAHGAGHAARVQLGSTSDRAAQLCKKPLLVIKRDAPVPRPGTRILVGIDGSPESYAAAYEAARLAAATGAGLRLAFVDDGATGLEEQAFEEATLRAAAAREASATFAIETVILRGKPADALADAARADDVALVAVGHRGRGTIARHLLGSTADRLLRIAEAPVLIVH